MPSKSFVVLGPHNWFRRLFKESIKEQLTKNQNKLSHRLDLDLRQKNALELWEKIKKNPKSTTFYLFNK